MLIADGLQFGDDVGKVFWRLQENVDVDDGLGGESGNRGASDVFDRGCERAEDGGDARANRVEALGPLRVVLFDNDGGSHSNCLRNVASCCWTSESSWRRRETSSSSVARRSAVEFAPAVAEEGVRATFTSASSASADIGGSPEKRCV